MHKTIGILGGLSPESTIAYYRHITRRYAERFGDYGYPPIVVYSVSFQPYVDWPEQGRWDLVAAGLTEAARKLEAAGADFIILATNTMHLVFDQVAGEIRDESRAGYARVINGLAAAGAQAVILGCTEIPLLIAERDVGVPLFDSTAIHAEAALDYAVS